MTTLAAKAVDGLAECNSYARVTLGLNVSINADSRSCCQH